MLTYICSAAIDLNDSLASDLWPRTANVCTYIHIHIYTCTHLPRLKQLQLYQARTYKYEDIHIHTYRRIHAPAASQIAPALHVHTNTKTCIHTYKHTLTHLPRLKQLQLHHINSLLLLLFLLLITILRLRQQRPQLLCARNDLINLRLTQTRHLAFFAGSENIFGATAKHFSDFASRENTLAVFARVSGRVVLEHKLCLCVYVYTYVCILT